MLYPKEDKSNKVLLYACRSLAVSSGNIVMKLYFQELRLQADGGQLLHLREQDHARGGRHHQHCDRRRV